MVARSALLVALLGVMTFAGCLSDDVSIPDTTEGSAAAGPNAGSPSTHGAADTAETPVTISRQGDDYVATKTVTYSNDFGGAASAKVTLTTSNGAVSASAWEDGGYQAIVTMTGRGATEQQARDRLAQLRPGHSDSLSGGRLTLATKVSFPVQSNGMAASIAGDYPEEPAYELTLAASNGAVRIEGLRGTTFSADTSNGLISVAATCDTLNADTSNGLISIAGKYRVIDAETSNGLIEADVESLATGKFAFATSNGGIQVDLDGPAGVGYDVTGDLGIGLLKVDIPDSEAVGTQSSSHKHVRTIGFAQKEIQVTVTAESSTGNIDVEA